MSGSMHEFVIGIILGGELMILTFPKKLKLVLDIIISTHAPTYGWIDSSIPVIDKLIHRLINWLIDRLIESLID